MSMKAYTIDVDGRVESVSPDNGTDFSLEELQGFVGGYIEIQPLRHMTGKVMVLNEEGKLIGLPGNETASMIYNAQFGRSVDHVCGRVLLCDSDMIR